MKKIVVFAIMLWVAISYYNYPLYRQYDPRWGDQYLGTSTDTIRRSGCVITSMSMGLTAANQYYDPGELNTWLKNNGGFSQGSLFIWRSVNRLGVIFEGKVSKYQIKAELDQGKIVICNVRNGRHWVLAYSYSGDNINVRDPGYSNTYYSLSSIVDGQNAVYRIGSRRLLTDESNSDDADGGYLDQAEDMRDIQNGADRDEKRNKIEENDDLHSLNSKLFFLGKSIFLIDYFLTFRGWQKYDIMIGNIQRATFFKESDA